MILSMFGPKSAIQHFLDASIFPDVKSMTKNTSFAFTDIAFNSKYFSIF